MQDTESLIASLTKQACDLEDIADSIGFQIDIAKADYRQKHIKYDQSWAVKAEYNMKTKRKEAMLLRVQLSDLRKELKLEQGQAQLEAGKNRYRLFFVPILREMIVAQIGESRTHDIFIAAGKKAEIDASHPDYMEPKK